MGGALQSRQSGPLRKAFLLAGALLSALYLLNPTLGAWEFLPDVLPIVGNLDEAGATAFLMYAWRELFPRRS